MAPVEFLLPDVGEGIATADIIAWKAQDGEPVREGQDLVEIQTDKATVVIPCPLTGVLARRGAAEGESLDVGALLAVFEADPGQGIAPANVADPSAEAAGVSRDVPAPAAAVAKPLAAPATRRLARELKVDLHGIAGSGAHGRILREDVEQSAGGGAHHGDGAPFRERAHSPPPRAPAAGELVELRGVRRSIALTLTRAWQDVPRVIDYREVDATALMSLRTRLQEQARRRGDERLERAMTPTPIIVKAAVHALREHPYVNASIDLEREQITLHRHYHVGIATAAPDGLMVPVVHDADRKSLAAIALEVAALSLAARSRRLSAAQLDGATFTVNNYGGLGIWLGTPIVRPPEVANLGVGAVRDQVVALAGRPVVRPTLVLAVAGDHRVLDGHTLAAFVSQVVELLEDPLLLLEHLV